MDSLKDTVATLVQNHLQGVINCYRHIHQNPELSFNEVNTSNYLKEILLKEGINIIPIEGRYSFIAVIEGNESGKTIGLRAELDALPVNEETTLDLRSQNHGIMHACGHDIHMASLIGVGLILNELKAYIKGTVLLIFESGEEQLPGGAKAIMESSEFKRLNPDCIIGMHVLPELNTGEIGVCSGRYMASGDEVYLTVKGKGGHAALPHTLVDPIVISSNILLNLQTIVSRNAPALIPTVLSFGRVEAMGATNVIPNEVKIAGTFRTMDESWRTKAHSLIVANAKGIAQSMGGDCTVEIRNGYPSVYNNPELTNKARTLAVELIGESKVIGLEPRMTTDDFAYFSQVVPSVFLRLGVGFDNAEKTQLHSPNFVANEKSLFTATSLLCWLVLKLAD
ncbi:amidohydrolase [Tenuifilaceae bacterium CYCD]|nr:amidohydrolase [Tenuifilaceae bacterium CYCD]